MKLEHSENSAEQKITGACGPQGQRRKLIQAGLVGTPLLLALKSTPVLAGNCKLPSGFSTSGNLSRNGGAACAPKMNGVTYWRSNIPAAQQIITFVSVFAKDSYPSAIANLTLMDALNRGATDINAKIVAAYRSANSGSFIDVATVQALWNQGVQSPAGYSAGTGVIWHVTEVNAYLDYVLA